jgi:hypothetical protein
MTTETVLFAPNPRRVEAGKRNVLLRRQGFTPEGLARLRVAAAVNQPWRFSTGPKTPAGKRRSAANGRARQKGELSVRQLRAERAGYLALGRQMMAGRRLLAGAMDQPGPAAKGAPQEEQLLSSGA